MRTVIPGPLAYAPHAHVAYGRPAPRSESFPVMERVGWLTLGAAALAFKQSRNTRRSEFDRAGSQVDAALLGLLGFLVVGASR